MVFGDTHWLELILMLLTLLIATQAYVRLWTAILGREVQRQNKVNGVRQAVAQELVTAGVIVSVMADGLAVFMFLYDYLPWLAAASFVIHLLAFGWLNFTANLQRRRLIKLIAAELALSRGDVVD